MNKSILIQLDQKEFEAVVFRAVCQAVNLTLATMDSKQDKQDSSDKTKSKQVNKTKKEV